MISRIPTGLAVGEPFLEPVLIQVSWHEITLISCPNSRSVTSAAPPRR